MTTKTQKKISEYVDRLDISELDKFYVTRTLLNLSLYNEKQIPLEHLGTFETALINNDLKLAALRADAVSLANLRHIILYIIQNDIRR